MARFIVPPFALIAHRFLLHTCRCTSSPQSYARLRSCLDRRATRHRLSAITCRQRPLHDPLPTNAFQQPQRRYKTDCRPLERAEIPFRHSLTHPPIHPHIHTPVVPLLLPVQYFTFSAYISESCVCSRALECWPPDSKRIVVPSYVQVRLQCNYVLY